ncbi:YicC domain protein [Thermotoga petrophila RKU-10]|uniref:YicC domain protein n=1 Tax=Thermotoga petrophila (strain ATCC BAA-489 / DSM 13996 / JCM 10882 / RKU-10) TaxID=590168 RepID=D2C8B6_THEP2|nr:YicC/YloC family endoribonuclease [Thermotoga petrophila]ADA67202.1 YicC domain protein [Thermotoga petrophila RKU-10]
MIKSMTGFSRVEKVSGPYQFRVEMKSLNSKGLNIINQLPGYLSMKELELNNLVQEYVSRGKVQTRVQVKFLEPPKVLEIDKNVVRAYYSMLDEIVGELSLPEPVKLSDLLNFREVFRIELSDEEIENIWNHLVLILREALEKLVEERKKEGQKIGADLKRILEDLSSRVEEIEKISDQLPALYREKIKEEVEKILPQDVSVKEDILENHVAFMATKADIREEITRLRSHIKRALELIESDEPVGMNLDFLGQEMLRELNTILSKSISGEITSLALEGKVLVSQFREQIQNVE